MKMNMKTLLNLTLAFCAILSSHAAPLRTFLLLTPISTVPMAITKPGHYYLVGNIFFNVAYAVIPILRDHGECLWTRCH